MKTTAKYVAAIDKKNRFISLALLLCLSCLLSGCSSKYYKSFDSVKLGKVGELEDRNVDIMGVKYTFFDSGDAAIISILNANASVTDTVTYNGKEYPVVVCFDEFGRPPYERLTSLFGYKVISPDPLILPEGIRTVTTSMLNGCTAKKIVLPPRLEAIYTSGLSGCSQAETIEFPESIKEMSGLYLFKGWSSLKTVTIPTTVPIWNLSYAFDQCESLESIVIPGNCEVIGDYCFSGCDNLSSVTLEEGIRTISRDAFVNCPKLTSIVLPNSIKVVPSGLFRDCPNLREVTLPDEITDVPVSMFKQSFGYYDADVSGITIRVRADMVDYAKSLYPAATVTAK